MKSASVPGSPNWDDDRVELHFNFSGAKIRADIKYFSVNSEGIYITDFPGSDQDFSVKKKKANGKWEVSYRLPLSCFGIHPSAGICWRISAGRFHRTNRSETSAFARIKGHFNRDPGAYRYFILSDKAHTPSVFLADSGEVSDYDNNSGRNALIFQADKKSSVADLNVWINDSPAKNIVRSGQNIVAYYNINGSKDEKLVFALKDKFNKILMRGKYDVKLFRNTDRVAHTKAPVMYQELFGNARKRPRIHIIWESIIRDKNFSDALKTGVPYSREKVLRDMREAGIRLLMRDAMDVYWKIPSIRKGNYAVPNTNPNMSHMPELIRKNLYLPVCLYSYNFISGTDKNGVHGAAANQYGFHGNLADPINVKAYLESVEKVMDVYKDEIDIFFYGDEVAPLHIYYGLKMDQPYNNQAFLKRWNAAVKAQDGDNRFGIPWGMKTTDPKYSPSIRAFRAYMNKHLLDIAVKASRIARSKKKDIIILSDDAYGVPSFFGVQFWHKYADWGSFQIGEGGSTTEKGWMPMMFSSKMVRDLSMLDDLLVVPHEAVSGYPGGALGQQEILEYYSQAIRGGATGFHFWSASYGQRTPRDGGASSVAIGYPLGYEYMIAITKQLNKMPDLKFPETKTAILVVDDSLMFDSKGYGSFKRAFTAIGQELGGWFKFVSDSNVISGKIDLGKYNLVYVPYASYIRKETVQALEKFVKNGGTVICGDPLFAEYNIHGDRVDMLAKAFGGVKWQKTKAVSLNAGGKDISVQAVKSFATIPSIKVLAKYNDGTAALIEKKFGKGKIIFSGFQLFPEKEKSMNAVIADLHKNNGGSVNQKIWHFKLPEPKVPVFAPKNGKCLTGNYGYWDRHFFFEGKFQNEENLWRCSVVKNGTSASSSKLFDRLSYFSRQTEFKNGPISAWVEEFSAGKHSIELSTARNIFISELVLYYAGECSGFTVETSADGKNWKKVSVSAVQKASENEVKRLSVACPGSWKQIRIKFNVSAGKKFTVAEAEVWKHEK